METDPRDDNLLDHNYDGIQEYDNPMPRWWVWIFWATIAFAVLYYFDFTGRIRGPGNVREYEAQLSDAARRWPTPAETVDPSALAVLARQPQALADGQAVFASTCAVCHRPDGGGLIGPNLTDEYWIHGATLLDIRRTVADGVLDKGMPGWSKTLKPDQVNAVAVYVASLGDTHPKDPKPPQGVKVDERHEAGDGKEKRQP